MNAEIACCSSISGEGCSHSEKEDAHSFPLRIALLAAAGSANTRSWVAGLQEERHHVEVFTLHPGEIQSVKVNMFEGSGRLRKGGYLLAVPRIQQALKTMNPNLVLAYYLTSYGIVSALAWDGPLVLAAAGSDILRPRQPIAWVGYRYLKRRGDLFIAWSNHMARRFEHLGVARNKIMVLHRGIDTDIFRVDGDRIPPQTRYTLISTRNFRPIYRLDTVVEATALVARQGYDVRYHLLGRGPLISGLHALANRLGIVERISFSGYHPPSMTASYLRGADIYVSASESDGASSSLFEAMACGLFPVVSDIPANRDWIQPGVNGYLVPVGDAAGFARAICEALDSEELRQAAACRNLQIVAEKLTRTKNQRVLSECFRRLVEEKE